jgi:hypothetical protein
MTMIWIGIAIGGALAIIAACVLIARALQYFDHEQRF